MYMHKCTKIVFILLVAVTTVYMQDDVQINSVSNSNTYYLNMWPENFDEQFRVAWLIMWLFEQRKLFMIIQQSKHFAWQHRYYGGSYRNSHKTR